MILEILKGKGIKETSIKLYLSNLKRLNNNVEPKTLAFLKNTKKILEQIKDKSENTKRTYLISICTVLSGDPKFKKQYDEYFQLLKDSNALLKNNNTKSEKQEANWISQEEINNIYKSYEDEVDKIKTKKKLNEKEYGSLLSYVILSLYLLIPPRRSLDFIKMIVGNDTNKDFNYLDMNESKFIFNNFKTAGTYQTQIIDIPENLMSVIKLYLSKRTGTKKNIPFLVKYDGEALTTSTQMTRILNKIFGKNISTQMIRNMYVTNKYKDVMIQKENDATAMGSSTSVLDSQYTKTD
jgi:vacuolar-type H+-ATPase subunit I/STV1